MIRIKRERWANRYVYVARENGKLKTWSNVKGSNTNLQSLKNKYKKTSSFKQNVQQSKNLNSNLKYIKYDYQTKIKGKKLSTQTGVEVQWFKNGKKIGVSYGHSLKGGTKKQAFTQAKQKAINNYNYFDYDEKGISYKAKYFKESFVSV